MKKYMHGVRIKINESGRIVIPAQFRRALNLKTDEELVLQLKEDGLVITPLKISLKKVRDKVKKYNTSHLNLTEALKNMREEDDSHG